MNYSEILDRVRATLKRNSDLAMRGLIDVESMIILQFALESVDKVRKSSTEIRLNLSESCSQDAAQVALAVANKRAEGEILQYVTGRQTFLEHEYRVTPDVLVPRPETEILLRMAADRLKDPTIGLELGLGSGAISIELLTHFPDLEMIATEVSQGAIQIARANAQEILGEGHSRMRVIPFVQLLDVCEPFRRVLKERRADFLISNPPYLTTSDEIADDVRKHEPEIALFAPLDDPLYFYRGIASQARSLLTPGGKIFLEIPHERAELIKEVFVQHSWKTEIETDLSGRPRVLIASPSDS